MKEEFKEKDKRPIPEVPKSLGRATQTIRDSKDAASLARTMIHRDHKEAYWDEIKARDVPAEVTQYVAEELKDGTGIREIQRNLGITSSNDKVWRKIMASLRQGFKIDTTGFFVSIVSRQEILSKKLFHYLDDYMDGTNPSSKMIMGKELSGLIVALNQLHQGTVKIGKDLGVFTDPNEAKGAGGVTIVVQTNVPMPSKLDIEAHRVKQSQVQTITIEEKDAVTKS